MINWMFFPHSAKPTPVAIEVVKVFEAVQDTIESGKANLVSNEVLAAVRPGLIEAGFNVETGKKSAEKISVPVLFGRNGVCRKAFHADAFHPTARMVLEVEAGRGVVNNQFLKDFFQACMMQDVEFLAIAVCNCYKDLKNFETVNNFFDTLYASDRLALPLKGILIIGY